MDKQEAIDYVLDELDKGRSPAEITAALSRRLGAPIDLVSKYVRQTAARYQESRAALSHEPIATHHEPLASSQQPSAFSAQPSVDSREPSAISQPPAAYSQPAAVGMAAGTMTGRSAGAEEAIPLPGAAYPAPDAGPSAPYAGPSAPDAGYAMPVEQTPRPAGRATVVPPELEKFILDELGKNKREGDVVLGVVEKTGMDYREAQLLVSRVGAQNYKKVTARQNCLVIPLALIALVAGLVLLGASVFEAYQIRVLLPSPNNLSMEQVQAAVERGRDLPWAFITGLALSVGGGIGLIAAIRKQME